MNNGPVFITGTYRSGSTYLSRILDAHPHIALIYDSVNYFRWYLKKNSNPQEFVSIVHDIEQRLKSRYDIELRSAEIIQAISSENQISHKIIYTNVMKSLSRNSKIWGEKTLLEWTNIPTFLSYFPCGKILHIIRDPREVMASYKYMTIEPGNRFLDSAYCSLSSLMYAHKYRNILDPEQYYIVKYEDLINNTSIITKDICKFLKIGFSESMLREENHRDMFGNVLTRKKHSSFPNVSLTKNWPSKLSEDEVSFVEYICRSEMQNFGYESSDAQLISRKYIDSVIRSDELLSKRHKIFELTGQGAEEYPSDPTLKENWGSDNFDPNAMGARELYGKK